MDSVLYGRDMTIESQSNTGLIREDERSAAISPSAMNENQPRYDELLRLGWPFLWGGVGTFVLLMFAGNVVLLFLFPELTRTPPTLWVAVLPIAFTTLISAFLIMPLIVRRIVTTPFRGFHLSFIRDRLLSP
ncbi:MAG: hypothetical protein LZF60_80269 [Nitrospira sp.]|nr:MAG: hypothetical protein LZF60_80269 [Nitrospira sp.]